MNFQFDTRLGVGSRESEAGRLEAGDTMEPCCLGMQLHNDETRTSGVVVCGSGWIAGVRTDVGHVGERGCGKSSPRRQGALAIHLQGLHRRH